MRYNHNSHQCGDGPRVFQCFNKTFSLTIGIDHPLTKSKARTKNVKHTSKSSKKAFRHISTDTVAITASFEYFNKTVIVNCFNQYQSNTSVIVVDQFCTWPSWGWSGQSRLWRVGGRSWMTVITPICVFSRTQLFKPAHFHILHLTHKVQVFTWRVSNFYRTRLYISSHCRVCTIAVLLSKPACTGGTSKDCVIPMPFILIPALQYRRWMDE